MSLGNLFTANAADEAERKSTEAARKIAEAERVRAAALQEVAAFLQKAKETTISAANNGKASAVVRVPDTDVFSTYQWFNGDVAKGETTAQSINDPTSLYRPLWKNFAEWLASEGLVGTFRYQHDGMGMKSWFVLCIEAA